MFAKNRFAHACLVAALLSACGEDKPDNTGNNSPDKPRGAAADGKVGNSDPDLSVADLNSAEWKAACLDLGSAGGSRELIHGPCIMAGLLATLIGADCSEMYEMCLAEPDSEECDEKPTDCTATLRELDDCSMSQMVWLAERTRGIDCSSSFTALLSIGEPPETPECKRLETTCPSFKTAAQSDDDEEWEF